MKFGAEIRLGVIGLSEGNGHPYSWSAIINGYDKIGMAACPFQVIPAYLAERRFPEDQLRGARVTHVWAQERAAAEAIALAARIPEVTGDFREMVGRIDALLLARDDAENHRFYAEPFLRAGLPIYVDKPAALRVADLDLLFSLARHPRQIFSCSALRYASELQLSAAERTALGPIQRVAGITPKSWDRYSMHLIDPVLSALQPGGVRLIRASTTGPRTTLEVEWEGGLQGKFEATGEVIGGISMVYTGRDGTVSKTFQDSFSAFRRALEAFLDGVRSGKSPTPHEYLRQSVALVEAGRTS